MPKISVTGGASQAGAPTQQAAPVLLRGTRIVVYDGSVEFGAVGAAPDVAIRRDGAGAVRVTGGLTVDSAVTQAGDVGLGAAGSLLGFFGTAPGAKPEVTGARDDGTALASLLTALATLGLITDSSTAS